MLEDLDTIADLIQKVAATAAFLVGGFWVLMNYRRNRTHAPRLQPLLTAEIIAGPAGRYILASIEIRNPGQSKIELKQNGEIPQGTALVVQPLFTAAGPLVEPVRGPETAYEILTHRTALEPGLAWHEQKLISVPDLQIRAFQLRLGVVAHGETFTVEAVAIEKQSTDSTSRSA
jgi:hypothetical protein